MPRDAVKTYGRSKISKQDALFDAVLSGAMTLPATLQKSKLDYDPYLFDSDDEHAQAALPSLSPAWKKTGSRKRKKPLASAASAPSVKSSPISKTKIASGRPQKQEPSFNGKSASSKQSSKLPDGTSTPSRRPPKQSASKSPLPIGHPPKGPPVGSPSPRRRTPKQPPVGSPSPRKRTPKQPSVGSPSPRRRTPKQPSVGSPSPRKRTPKQPSVGSPSPRKRTPKQPSVGSASPRGHAPKQPLVGSPSSRAKKPIDVKPSPKHGLLLKHKSPATILPKGRGQSSRTPTDGSCSLPKARLAESSGKPGPPPRGRQPKQPTARPESPGDRSLKHTMDEALCGSDSPRKKPRTESRVQTSQNLPRRQRPLKHQSNETTSSRGGPAKHSKNGPQSPNGHPSKEAASAMSSPRGRQRKSPANNTLAAQAGLVSESKASSCPDRPPKPATDEDCCSEQVAGELAPPCGPRSEREGAQKAIPSEHLCIEKLASGGVATQDHVVDAVSLPRLRVRPPKTARPGPGTPRESHSLICTPELFDSNTTSPALVSSGSSSGALALSTSQSSVGSTSYCPARGGSDNVPSGSALSVGVGQDFEPPEPAAGKSPRGYPRKQLCGPKVKATGKSETVAENTPATSGDITDQGSIAKRSSASAASLVDGQKQPRGRAVRSKATQKVIELSGASSPSSSPRSRTQALSLTAANHDGGIPHKDLPVAQKQVNQERTSSVDDCTTVLASSDGGGVTHESQSEGDAAAANGNSSDEDGLQLSSRRAKHHDDSSTVRPLSTQSKRFVRTPRTKTPAKYTYNPRPWSTGDEEQLDENCLEETASSVTQASSDLVSHSQRECRTPEPSDPPKIRKSVSWPTKTGDNTVTSLKVRRGCKELYTVVHNVKHASECQERGESQQFDDDLEFLLDGMKDTESYSTRCLSTLSLAAKCAAPGFRMHLKAEGTVTHIFQLLQDACSDKSLALCTACVMYMLSRDRLNMDLDKRCLALMVKLLSETAATTPNEAKDYEKVRDKVVALCCSSDCVGSQEQAVTSSEGDSPLNGCDMSAAHLAMESLLSLTSRRAGDWFKEELRLLGGLDHIVDAILDCEDSLSLEDGRLTPSAVEPLLKICRCLRVLENVTFLNSENQEYLMTYKDGALVSSSCRLLTVLHNTICSSSSKARDEAGARLPSVLLQAMLATLRLLLNLTHDHDSGSKCIGSGDNGLLARCVHCILQCPQHLPAEQRFDVLVLGLGLLVNLIEHSAVNRAFLSSLALSATAGGAPAPEGGQGALAAIAEMFMQRLKAADKLEKEANDSSNNLSVHLPGDSDLGGDLASPAAAASHDDSLTEILHKAGKHMEDSIVAAYAALVLACLVLNRGGPEKDDETGAVAGAAASHIDAVLLCLPGGSLKPLVDVLQKFLGFIKLTDATASSGSRSIADVIQALEKLC